MQNSQTKSAGATPESFTSQIARFCVSNKIDPGSLFEYAISSVINSAKDDQWVLKGLHDFEAGGGLAGEARGAAGPVDINSEAFLEALVTQEDRNDELRFVLSNPITMHRDDWANIVRAEKKGDEGTRLDILMRVIWYGLTAYSAYGFDNVAAEKMYDDLRAGIAARKEKAAK